MLATWMIYYLTLTALVFVGALLIESVMRLYGAETRWVWAVAMLAAVLLPALAFVLGGEPAVGGAAGTGVTRFPGAWFFLAVEPVVDTVDASLRVAWIVLSGAVGLGFLLSTVRVRLASRSWRSLEVEGVRVLVSEDVGPAVVGVVDCRIVMPEWALESSATALSLMLRHEREHLAARDPQLVLLASTLLVLMPWNAPLWWMSKRLRLALEVDCDRRVLRSAECDVRTYGALLVDVGRRQSGPVYAGAGFSWARSLLEHRILQMTARTSGRRNLRAGGLLAASVLILVGAGFMPTPPSMQAWASGSWMCEATGQWDTGSRGAASIRWRS